MKVGRPTGPGIVVRAMLATGVSIAASSVPAAQTSNAVAPAVVGHFHLNVTSIEAHKKFWADALGGQATKVHGIDVVRFPDVDVFLRQQKPTGPTRGTAFDHIGFAVPNVPEFTTYSKPSRPIAAAPGLSPVRSMVATTRGVVPVSTVTVPDRFG